MSDDISYLRLACPVDSAYTVSLLATHTTRRFRKWFPLKCSPCATRVLNSTSHLLRFESVPPKHNPRATQILSTPNFSGPGCFPSHHPQGRYEVAIDRPALGRDSCANQFWVEMGLSTFRDKVWELVLM